MNALRIPVALLMLAAWPVSVDAQGGGTGLLVTTANLRRAVAGVSFELQTPAQSSADRWAAVRNLQISTQVRVLLTGNLSYSGQIRSVDAASITLWINGSDTRFPREQVREVSIRHRRGRSWIAAGIFGGLGVGVLSCIGQPSECYQGWPPTGALIGLPVGLIISVWPSWRRVYAAGI